MGGAARSSNVVREQRLIAGQARILEMIASGAPAARVLRAIVSLIESRAPDMLASILLVEDGKRVRHGAAVRLPAAYMRRIDGEPIGPRAGSCGTAAYLKRAVIASDIRRDRRWAGYRDIAERFGLRACWSTPIFDGRRRVLGTFALYFRRPGRPAARHKRDIGVATHMAALALMRAGEEQERVRLVHALGERVKELTVVHRWAALLQKDPTLDAALLGSLASLLPSGWQHPGVCVARIACGELEASTPGWRDDAAWRQSTSVQTSDGTRCLIEVAYVEARPATDEGPFLAEERKLLKSLADMLAAHIERSHIHARLRDREAMFRSIFDSAAIGVTLVDMDGRIASSNPALARMLGYAEAELAGKSIADITHPEDVALSTERYRTLAAGALEHYQLEKRYLRKDGSVVWTQLTASILPRPGRAPRFSIGMIEDISARKRAEQALRESEQRFREMAETSPDAILIHQDERIVFVNRAMLDLLRAGDAAELAGRPATFMLPTELVEGARRRIAALYAGQPQPRAEQTYVRVDGTPVDVEVAAAPIVLGGRPAAQVTVRDITGRKQAEAKVRQLAYFEPLTGMPNRASLQARLAQAVAAAAQGGNSAALLLMNLNNFREINNTLGHQNGDALLRQVAATLQATLWESDMVACLGGDEFAVLLARLADHRDIELVLQKILGALRRPVSVVGVPINVEASFGIAIYPEHGEAAETLWQRADIALRAAKEKQRDFLVYRPDIDHHDPSHLALLGELGAAIDRNELVLHYQPTLHLASGRAIGAEALVRWQHPVRGLVYPDGFVPLAERTQLINPLTTCVLANALRQGQAWQREGLPLSLSVNLSARNLQDPELGARIVELARSSRFPLQRLTVEVTETAIMADSALAKKVLTVLHEAGISISMDDFGIGQSSLAYLKDLPISRMKIDKSFVMGFGEARNAAIVRSAVALAHNLGLGVTAEGVENEETLVELREMGCDLAQGYYIARPMPVDRASAWFRERAGIAGASAT